MESWDRCTVETRFRLGCFQQSSRPRRSTPQDAGARKRPPRPVETGDVWHRSLTPNEIKDSNFMTYECSSDNPKVQSKRNPTFHDLMIYNSNFSIFTGNFGLNSPRFVSPWSPPGIHWRAPDGTCYPLDFGIPHLDRRWRRSEHCSNWWWFYSNKWCWNRCFFL